MKYSAEAATAVVGLAAFELWKAWGYNAPALSAVRAAPADDITIRQQLMDADITVGSLAVIIGVAMAILTKDMTALIILMVVFGALSFFHHWVMDAESR